jgi:hypothetical protein
MFAGRSGFSRDPCAIENRDLGVAEAIFTATPASSKAEVRGESPSYRNRLFVGAALAATLASSRTGISGLPKQSSPQPLRHRRRRFGAEDRGSSSRRTGDGVEGNCGQLPCLNPMAQREGGGLCPSPIIQGHEPGRLSSKLPEDYTKKGLNPRRRRRGMRRAARSVVRGPGGWAPGRRTMAWLCEEARAGWSRRQRIELSTKERERCAKPSPSRSAIW